MNKLFFSIDLDEWYQARWAENIKKQFIKDENLIINPIFYNERIDSITKSTKYILNELYKYELKITFFVTGEIAIIYESLLNKIKDLGHEIGTHNMYHKNYNRMNVSEFSQDLKKSINIIEEITQEKVIGHRAPNSVIYDNQIPILIKNGIKYDSSITPTFNLFGKFGGSIKGPNGPYRVHNNTFSKKGNSELFEFPWPTFPGLRFPSGSGYTTRMFGAKFTFMALNYHLRRNHTVYYFHPFELEGYPKNYYSFKPYRNLVTRNIGIKFKTFFKSFLERYSDRIISGEDLLKII